MVSMNQEKKLYLQLVCSAVIVNLLNFQIISENLWKNAKIWEKWICCDWSLLFYYSFRISVAQALAFVTGVKGYCGYEHVMNENTMV